MQAYVARRLLQAIPVLLLITFFVFYMEQLIPGDPVYALIGSSGGQELAPSVIQQYRKEFHLSDPIPVQYAIWLQHAVHGDLGKSIKSQGPVTEELRSRIPVTLQLGLAALVIGIVVSFPLGVTAALYRNSLLDRAITVFSIVAVSIPQLVLALGLLAALGRSVHTLVIAIGIGGIAFLARLVRSQVLTVRELDYVLAARTIGARPVRILFRHVWPNCSAPVIVALSLGVGFAVLAESGLSFLGLGVPPPTPSWGSLLQYAFQYLYGHAYLSIVPGVSISLLILALSLIGDGLRDVLDPSLRGRN